jgi:ribosomal protein L32
MPALATKPVLPPLEGRLFEPGRATLDDRVSATWRRLVEQGAASCLVCGAETRAGRPCPCCGSELS